MLTVLLIMMDNQMDIDLIDIYEGAVQIFVNILQN